MTMNQEPVSLFYPALYSIPPCLIRRLQKVGGYGGGDVEIGFVVIVKGPDALIPSNKSAQFLNGKTFYG
jgi:hypothetical protein